MDSVAISSAIPHAGQVAGLAEIGDDPLDGPFRDSDAGRNVPCSDRGVLVDADEDVGMVGQEGPVSAQLPSSFLRSGRGMRWFPVAGMGPGKMPLRLSNADCRHLFRGRFFMYCLL